MKNTVRNIFALFLTVFMLLQSFFPNPTFAESESFLHTNEIVGGECEREIEGEIHFTTPEEEKNIDLVIVQDASGSFKNTIGEMKEALGSLIEVLKPGDQVMIVTYQGGNKVVYRNQHNVEYDRNTFDEWLPVTLKTIQKLTSDHDSAKASIKNIEVEGATPTALGLEYALEVYNQSETPHNEETVFLLVTDGVANVRLDETIVLDIEGSKYANGGYYFHEYYQDYKTAVEESVQQANEIKSKGYHFVSTFIEDLKMLSSSSQYGSRYQGEVRDHVREKLKSMATSEEYFQVFENPNAFKGDMVSLLSNLREKLTSSKLSVNIEPGYEVTEAALYKGEQKLYDVQLKEGLNEIFVENTGIEENYRLVYKLKEKGLNKTEKTPVKASFNGGDKNIDYKDPIVEANKNEVCELSPVQPKKSVNKKEHEDLKSLYEVFTYEVEIEMKHLYGLEKFEIKDQVDELLSIDEESIQVEVDNERLPGRIEVDGNSLSFVIDKSDEEYKDFDFSTLEEKTVVLRFDAKINEAFSYEDVLNRYENGKVPNTADVYFNNEHFVSNEVTVKAPEPLNIEVEKKWVGGPEDKPSVEILLLQDGEEFDRVTLDSETGWTYTWTNLDPVDSNGEPHNYTVEEVEVPENYEKSIDGYIVTNTYVSPKTEVTVEKEWVGGPEEKPSIEVVLLQDGEEFDRVTLDSETGWTYTWDNLDLTDSNGKAYDYTVDEVDVPENYEKSIDGYTITNTYVSPKTEVTVEKEWVGGPEEKPSVEVVLLQDGEEFDRITLDSETGWTYTWKDLDATDSNGEPYKYTVDEVDVPENYEKSIDGYTITNTYVSPKTKVTVEKEWVGGPEEKPSVEVVLYQDGEEFDRITLDSETGWTYTWKNLDLTDSSGKAYDYTVDEVDVPENYEKEIKGHIITNTYVSPKTEVTVEKEWVGGPEEKPSVEIGLYRNGELYDTVVLDGSEEWTYTWTELDTKDENGVLYVYTVDELDVPEYYEKEVQGFKIINRFEEVEEVKEANVEPPKKSDNRPNLKTTLIKSSVLPSTGKFNYGGLSIVLILLGFILYRREER